MTKTHRKLPLSYPTGSGPGPPGKKGELTPRAHLRELIDASADLLLGAACPGCGSPGLGPCSDCLQELMTLRPLSRVIGTAGSPSGELPVFACHPYARPISNLIVAHKERGAWRLADYFAQAMASRLEADVSLQLLGDAVLVPVPSDDVAERERGYDHAAAIARALARRSGASTQRPLRRTRSTGDQVGRDRVQRQAAQLGSMTVKPGELASRLRDRPLILVDDVVTTGATLQECSRALRAAGLRPVLGICLASSG